MPEIDTYECSKCGGTWFKSLGTKCPDCGTEVKVEEPVEETPKPE